MKLPIPLGIAPALLFLLGPLPAPAETVQIRTPVAFTLPGCSQLPAGLTVSGSGESFVVLTTRIDKLGNTVIVRNNLVTGTATDSNGETYTFNYFNHSIMTVPPGGFPFTVSTTDHFNLVGNGKAGNLAVHFAANLTVFSLNPFIVTADFKNIHGDPFTCDPI